MSEQVETTPAEIVPAKSEDKLEIQKEEEENKVEESDNKKAEETQEEKAADNKEEVKDESEKGESDEKAALLQKMDWIVSIVSHIFTPNCTQ